MHSLEQYSQENVLDSEEGYLLKVFANKIVISAKTMKGFFMVARHFFRVDEIDNY